MCFLVSFAGRDMSGARLGGPWEHTEQADFLMCCDRLLALCECTRALVDAGIACAYPYSWLQVDPGCLGTVAKPAP